MTTMDLENQFKKETIEHVKTFDCRYADQYVWWLERKVIELTPTFQKSPKTGCTGCIHYPDGARCEMCLNHKHFEP